MRGEVERRRVSGSERVLLVVAARRINYVETEFGSRVFGRLAFCAMFDGWGEDFGVEKFPLVVMVAEPSYQCLVAKQRLNEQADSICDDRGISGRRKDDNDRPVGECLSGSGSNGRHRDE